MKSAVSSSGNGATFFVDKVEPARELLFSESLEQCLNRRFARKILILPEKEQQVTNALAGAVLNQFGKSSYDIHQIGSRCHPLIDAVHSAFADHRPLTLSPDDIWLVIAR